METTNAIEKALKKKIDIECKEIVDKFIADLIKLEKKYGGCSFYDFKKASSNGSEPKEFMVSGTLGVSIVLHRMILDNHGGHMLKQKSQELIEKLDLI